MEFLTKTLHSATSGVHDAARNAMLKTNALKEKTSGLVNDARQQIPTVNEARQQIPTVGGSDKLNSPSMLTTTDGDSSSFTGGARRGGARRGGSRRGGVT